MKPTRLIKQGPGAWIRFATEPDEPTLAALKAARATHFGDLVDGQRSDGPGEWVVPMLTPDLIAIVGSDAIGKAPPVQALPRIHAW